MLVNTMLATYGEEFARIIYDLNNSLFLENRATFKEFIRLVEDRSKLIEDESDRYKFKGDCLEIFAEIFFLAFKNDPCLGLVDYKPVDIGEDYGVDATGFNADGRKVAVQVKYRANPLDLVLYAEIAKTFASGCLIIEGMDLFNKQSIYVFTSAIGVTPACQKVFGNRLVVLNLDIINEKVENNDCFWEFAYNEVFSYLDS